MIKKHLLILIFIVIASTLLISVGCSNPEANQETGMENTSTGEPSMAKFNPENEKPVVKSSYLFAKDNYKLLSKFYCVCGCMVNNGHKGLANCFIKKIDSKGKVTWDGHGTFCKVCQDEALDIKTWKEEGKSMDEMIKLFKEKYGSQPGAPKNWDFN